MRRPHRNKTNPCAKILAEMAKTCFLIGEETDFDTQLTWSGHVNEIHIYVQPKGANINHAVLEFNEYINIPQGASLTSDFKTDTYPRVKKFAAELNEFYEQRSAG